MTGATVPPTEDEQLLMVKSTGAVIVAMYEYVIGVLVGEDAFDPFQPENVGELVPTQVGVFTIFCVVQVSVTAVPASTFFEVTPSTSNWSSGALVEATFTYTVSVTAVPPPIGVQLIVYVRTIGDVVPLAGTVTPKVAPVGDLEPDQSVIPELAVAVHAPTLFEVHESEAAPPDDGIMSGAGEG